MIKEIDKKEIPECVNVIRESFWQWRRNWDLRTKMLLVLPRLQLQKKD